MEVAQERVEIQQSRLQLFYAEIDSAIQEWNGTYRQRLDLSQDKILSHPDESLLSESTSIVQADYWCDKIAERMSRSALYDSPFDPFYSSKNYTANHAWFKLAFDLAKILNRKHLTWFNICFPTVKPFDPITLQPILDTLPTIVYVADVFPRCKKELIPFYFPEIYGPNPIYFFEKQTNRLYRFVVVDEWVLIDVENSDLFKERLLSALEPIQEKSDSPILRDAMRPALHILSNQALELLLANFNGYPSFDLTKFMLNDARTLIYPLSSLLYSREEWFQYSYPKFIKYPGDLAFLNKHIKREHTPNGVSMKPTQQTLVETLSNASTKSREHVARHRAANKSSHWFLYPTYMSPKRVLPSLREFHRIFFKDTPSYWIHHHIVYSGSDAYFTRVLLPDWTVRGFVSPLILSRLLAVLEQYFSLSSRDLNVFHDALNDWSKEANASFDTNHMKEMLFLYSETFRGVSFLRLLLENFHKPLSNLYPDVINLATAITNYAPHLISNNPCFEPVYQDLQVGSQYNHIALIHDLRALLSTKFATNQFNIKYLIRDLIREVKEKGKITDTTLHGYEFVPEHLIRKIEDVEWNTIYYKADGWYFIKNRENIRKPFHGKFPFDVTALSAEPQDPLIKRKILDVTEGLKHTRADGIRLLYSRFSRVLENFPEFEYNKRNPEAAPWIRLAEKLFGAGYIDSATNLLYSTVKDVIDHSTQKPLETHYSYCQMVLSSDRTVLIPIEPAKQLAKTHKFFRATPERRFTTSELAAVCHADPEARRYLPLVLQENGGKKIRLSHWLLVRMLVDLTLYHPTIEKYYHAQDSDFDCFHKEEPYEFRLIRDTSEIDYATHYIFSGFKSATSLFLDPRPEVSGIVYLIIAAKGVRCINLKREKEFLITFESLSSSGKPITRENLPKYYWKIRYELECANFIGTSYPRKKNRLQVKELDEEVHYAAFYQAYAEMLPDERVAFDTRPVVINGKMKTLRQILNSAHFSTQWTNIWLMGFLVSIDPTVKFEGCRGEAKEISAEIKLAPLLNSLRRQSFCLEFKNREKEEEQLFISLMVTDFNRNSPVYRMTDFFIFASCVFDGSSNFLPWAEGRMEDIYKTLMKMIISETPREPGKVYEEIVNTIIYPHFLKLITLEPTLHDITYRHIIKNLNIWYESIIHGYMTHNVILHSWDWFENVSLGIDIDYFSDILPMNVCLLYKKFKTAIDKPDILDKKNDALKFRLNNHVKWLQFLRALTPENFLYFYQAVREDYRKAVVLDYITSQACRIDGCYLEGSVKKLFGELLALDRLDSVSPHFHNPENEFSLDRILMLMSTKTCMPPIRTSRSPSSPYFWAHIDEEELVKEEKGSFSDNLRINYCRT